MSNDLRNFLALPYEELEELNLVAKAQRKNMARETYESALERGKTSVLHEEVLRGVHMLSVGHIPPGAEKPFSESDMSDKVKKGFYLATIGHCFECHTPMGPKGREFETRYGAGGFDFPGPWGKSTSRNITSSKEKGIGAWTDDEIKRAITKGVRKDGTPLKPPMGFGFYANMTDADLDAVVAYLRTVPPKE